MGGGGGVITARQPGHFLVVHCVVPEQAYGSCSQLTWWRLSHQMTGSGYVPPWSVFFIFFLLLLTFSSSSTLPHTFHPLLPRFLFLFPLLLIPPSSFSSSALSYSSSPPFLFSLLCIVLFLISPLPLFPPLHCPIPHPPSSLSSSALSYSSSPPFLFFLLCLVLFLISPPPLFPPLHCPIPHPPSPLFFLLCIVLFLISPLPSSFSSSALSYSSTPPPFLFFLLYIVLLLISPPPPSHPPSSFPSSALSCSSSPPPSSFPSFALSYSSSPPSSFSSFALSYSSSPLPSSFSSSALSCSSSPPPLFPPLHCPIPHSPPLPFSLLCIVLFLIYPLPPSLFLVFLCFSFSSSSSFLSFPPHFHPSFPLSLEYLLRMCGNCIYPFTMPWGWSHLNIAPLSIIPICKRGLLSNNLLTLE